MSIAEKVKFVEENNPMRKLVFNNVFQGFVIFMTVLPIGLFFSLIFALILRTK
ncbi:MAG: hypothetical protein ACJAZ3_000853 [Sphingobacteriales bacterium]|jgi:hypothetical protein